jgi:hypothetical protein
MMNDILFLVLAGMTLGDEGPSRQAEGEGEAVAAILLW